MNLKGKTALVTGAGRGVGRATALALAEAGCDVVLNYRRNRAGAEETADRVRALGARAAAVQGDVSQDADCRRLVASAEELTGALHILINNAGTTVFVPHEDLDAVADGHWSRLFDTNVKGVFQMARAARPLMTQSGGGDIVNIASTAGVLATGSSIPYCASKAAAINLTMTLARVFAPTIRVNAVAPGFIDGDWLREGLGESYEAARRERADKNPLNRVCQPEDVAAAALSLAAGSDLVTGQTLLCDGGMSIIPQ